MFESRIGLVFRPIGSVALVTEGPMEPIIASQQAPLLLPLARFCAHGMYELLSRDYELHG